MEYRYEDEDSYNHQGEYKGEEYILYLKNKYKNKKFDIKFKLFMDKSYKWYKKHYNI